MIDPVVAQILIAIIINVPFWYVMRANFRKTTSETESTSIRDALTLKSEYKAEMQELRQELKSADILIAELKERDAKREADMIRMRSDFEKEKLIRDEVVLALTEKVRKLEELVSERDKEIEALRAQLQIETSERDSVIVNLQSQISKLQSQHVGLKDGKP